MATEQMREYFKPATGRVLRLIRVYDDVARVYGFKSVYVFLPIPPVPVRTPLSAAEVGAGRSEK